MNEFNWEHRAKNTNTHHTRTNTTIPRESRVAYHQMSKSIDKTMTTNSAKATDYYTVIRLQKLCKRKLLQSRNHL